MKPGPLERLQAISDRNAVQVEREKAQRASAAAAKRVAARKLRTKARSAQAKVDALEKVREEKQAARDAARAAAKKARDRVKRAKLRAAWRVEAEAAMARGEPFKSDVAQRAYMSGKRSLERCPEVAITGNAA